MPLVMLNPDPDGKTALDLAIEQLVPRSFEMMIDMLEYAILKFIKSQEEIGRSSEAKSACVCW